MNFSQNIDVFGPLLGKGPPPAPVVRFSYATKNLLWVMLITRNVKAVAIESIIHPKGTLETFPQRRRHTASTSKYILSNQTGRR